MRISLSLETVKAVSFGSEAVPVRCVEEAVRLGAQTKCRNPPFNTCSVHCDNYQISILEYFNVYPGLLN